MANAPQSVVLTVPRGPFALSAMRLVVGWVASCNDLPLDRIDDVNLALETLISGEVEQGAALELSLSAWDGVLEVSLQGLCSSGLRANLQESESFSPSFEWPLDIRLFLGALLDDYKMVDPDAESFGVLMQKRIR